MKKFITTILALCITASMTGCSPEPKTPLEGKIMEEYVKSMDMDIKFTQVRTISTKPRIAPIRFHPQFSVLILPL